MSILKYLIASFLAASAPLTPEEAGWYPVDNPRKETASSVYDEEGDEWVYFTKNLGSENFTIQFPNDPSYRILEIGGLEVTFQDGDDMFQLIVIPKNNPPLPENGGWAYERAIQAENFRYYLRAQSEGEKAERFISSLQPAAAMSGFTTPRTELKHDLPP